MEEWKTITDFPAYEVSNQGRVRRDEHIRKLKTDKYGYYVIDLWKNGQAYWKLVHRLVAETFILNPDNELQVDHINRKPADNRVENLRWRDSYGNMDNRARGVSGEKFIRWCPRRLKWIVSIHNSRQNFCRTYWILEHAIEARDEILSTA
jgi:hypothetical protein